MGKRKRSRSKDDDYDNILKKVKKLERRLKKRRRHSSSSSNNDSVNTGVNNLQRSDSLQSLYMDSVEVDKIPITEQTGDGDIVPNDETISDEPGLDPEILEILGDDLVNQNKFGKNLHKDITPRWQQILMNGLPKEKRSDLTNLYLIPENCKSMKPPKLNLEIKAALTEINLKKDNFNENKQNQLSSGLVALGQALNIALSTSQSQELIKYLSDAGRLLCDYHYRETMARRYSIISTLNKQTRDTIRNTKFDEFIFGSDLSEHIKSSKAIAKSGSELKSSYVTRPQIKPAATNQPQRGALNSRGTSRPAAPEARPYNAARRPGPAPTVRHRRHDATSSQPTYQRQRGRKR